MKKIITLLLTFIVLISVAACGSKSIRIDMSGASKIVLFSADGGRWLEIEDEEEINGIANNFKQLTFNKQKTSTGYDGFSYSIKWYDAEGDLRGSFTIMGETRIQYKQNFYEVEGEGKIDVDFLYRLFNPYYEKPTDSDLAFWITEDVSLADFSSYRSKPSFMGAIEYFPNEYEEGATEYVSYLVGAYPDYADGGTFVTRIFITDKNVKVLNGLTITSTVEDWDLALQDFGFYRIKSEEKLDEGIEYKELWHSGDDQISFTLIKGKESYSLSIYVPVFNREELPLQ